MTYCIFVVVIHCSENPTKLPNKPQWYNILTMITYKYACKKNQIGFQVIIYKSFKILTTREI